jgi:hypothetical protein
MTSMTMTPLLWFFLWLFALLHTSIAGSSPSSPKMSAKGESIRNSTKYGLESDYDRVTTQEKQNSVKYGRKSDDEFVLTPEQIETFRKEGCVTIPDVLTEEEVVELEEIFDRFMSGSIPVPAKDFCDMSKPFGIPSEQWSIVNCMLPTTYYPPLRGNVYERLTASMARQLFPSSDMTKDYDQLLNKRPGKTDAVFAWHQDMGYCECT